MKRYRVVTYKLENVKRNIRSKSEAIELAHDLIRTFNIEKSFFVRTDYTYTILTYLSLIIRILYIPAYCVGIILLIIGRLILVFAYLLILKLRPAINILKFMFIWQQ